MWHLVEEHSITYEEVLRRENKEPGSPNSTTNLQENAEQKNPDLGKFYKTNGLLSSTKYCRGWGALYTKKDF